MQCTACGFPSAVAPQYIAFELHFIPHIICAGSFIALLGHARKTSRVNGRRHAEHVCVAVNETHQTIV